MNGNDTRHTALRRDQPSRWTPEHADRGRPSPYQPRDRGLLRVVPQGATGVAAVFADHLAAVAGGRLGQLPVAVRFWDGSMIEPGEGDRPTPTIVVRDPAALAHLLREPNQLGLARAWVEGALQLEGDIEAVLRLRSRFQHLRLRPTEKLRLAWAAARVGGPRVLRRPAIPEIEARPRGRRHSIARDRSSVRHHYELSNRFYELLLGPSMVYSCAYFDDRGDTLEAAQERKLETICRKLRLGRGDRLLDIGCGWGSLLVHAAIHHGARGVGVTLSHAQAQFARERIAQAGLNDRLEVRVCDYREIRDGPYDRIVSVGMYEHVGRSQLRRYACTLGDLLRPGGLLLNHGIARLDSEPPTEDTFIARYIFPDGELHPLTDVLVAMQAAGFEVRDAESLREHYVLTLRRWVANLDANRAAAESEIGATRLRVWRVYMLGCAQAFEDGEISVYQVLAARVGGPHDLPLNRALLGTDSPAAGEARGSS